MSTIVMVKALNGPVVVTSQKILDGGRERVPNGVDEIANGDQREFIIDDFQSIIIEEQK